MNISHHAAPPGWTVAAIGGTFATHNGPLYARWHDNKLQVGFRVGPTHVNPANACHGGMLSTFADVLISNAALYQSDIPRQFLPTISLQMDFLAPAPLGSWVHGEGQVLKVTKNLVFSQGLVYADGALVLRTSGVFRRGPLLPDTESDRPLELPGLKAR